MEHVARAVTESFDSRLQANSQAVPAEAVHCLRNKYLHSIQNETDLNDFLLLCSTRLHEGLICAQPSACELSIAYAHPHEHQQDYYEQIHFHNDFHTLGRHGDIRVHNDHSNVSRIQALLCVVAHNDGRKLLVILDWWSRYGTAIKGTAHCSLPNDRRVLVTPVDNVVALELGVQDMSPLTVVLNAPECLICKDQPRTEVFETCGHLVACKSCFGEMTKHTAVIDCPICRRPVSARNTRSAQYRRMPYVH